MDIIIPEKLAGMTVGHCLRFEYGVSYSLLLSLKNKDRGITLNGRPVTVRTSVLSGDVISLAAEDESSGEKIIPKKLPVDILYEDDYIIAVDKPPMMPTHPSHLHRDDTLANALAFIFEERGVPFVFRAAGRLDRNTSGVVIVAKNRYASSRISQELAERKTEKEYIALLEGCILEDCGHIDRYIRRSPDSIITREVTDNAEGSERAITDFSVIARGQSCTLVRAHPLTGRTHQLRVHFSSIGHPICGDDLYGAEKKEFPRQMLHAYSYAFTHPFTGNSIKIIAPPPPDLTDAAYERLNYRFNDEH